MSAVVLPVAAGAVFGLGFVWITIWLLASWGNKVGIYSASGVYPSPERQEQANAEGRAFAIRWTQFMRKGVPFAVAVMVVGVVLAIIAAV